ncbi:MAG: hypothetical protein LBU51_09935 [Bacteroidales bacterium]|nr:hypothetical protein [Bacteroidales bacterium]
MFIISSLPFLNQAQNDTIKRISPNAIEQIVTYKSVDSIVIDVKMRKAYLFKTAEVLYEDVELYADYIEIDFKNNELFASGIADSSGNIHGSPKLSQDGSDFWAQEIKYNFTTKKGKITSVITTEGEGFVHGKYVKKFDDYSFIKDGLYTTCELDDPHFEIAFTKAKFVNGKKIITGPAYLSFAGIPTFLAIPFGYFPNEKGRSSGLVMPTFGEAANRGFYFENLGYYFGISDNFDLLLAGDIYTRGSWAVKALSNYVFRYKCSGFVDVSYAQNFMGERYTPSYSKANDFKIKWEHNQDPKSHPVTRFSAHVDIVSRTFNKYNPSTINDYLSNQYTSKINFSTNIKNIFFFDASMSYSQSTQTGMVDFALPDMNLSVNQFYPFRKKNKVGKLKWYDNISLKWNSQFTNSISTYDSLLVKRQTWEEMKVGMRHVIPLTIPVKIAKLINWNTNITFTEKWYLQSITKGFDTLLDVHGNRYSMLTDTFHRRFNALHELSMQTALTTKIYLMTQFKKGNLLAIRHVITPNLNFLYNPDLMGDRMNGTYFNTITGQEVPYSYYEKSNFGSVNTNTQANLRLSISNNIEMKVKSKRDTITGTRKLVLVEDLTLSMFYNFAADSLRLSPLTISGRTTLFKQLYLTFNIGFDPYCLTDSGKRINKYEVKENKKLFRFSSSNISVGLNWRLDASTFGRKKKEDEKKESATNNQTIFTENSLGMPNTRPDFNNPWSVTLNYTFAYNVQENPYFKINYDKQYINTIVQTLNIAGDFSITRKWKVGFTTGFDFTNKSLSYTSIDIYRDLHCWEMRFNWIPFGGRKGWSFTINVKASVLQDMKFNMKRDFRNNL